MLHFFAFIIGWSSLGAVAAPECLVDSKLHASDRLIAHVTGEVKGFNPGPVYVTVTNGGKSYTTVINRDGKWGIVHPDLSAETTVECWQGWPGQDVIIAQGHAFP